MKKYIPDFFKKFNNYLVVNHPGTWDLKLHIILPILFVYILAATALGYTFDAYYYYALDGKYYAVNYIGTYFIWFHLFTLPAVFYWGYLIIRSRKRYLPASGLSYWFSSIMFLLVLNLLVAPGYIFSWIMESRALSVATQDTLRYEIFNDLGYFAFLEYVILIISLLLIMMRQLPFKRVAINLVIALVSLFLVVWTAYIINYDRDHQILIVCGFYGLICSTTLLVTLKNKKISFKHYFLLVSSITFFIWSSVFLLDVMDWDRDESILVFSTLVLFLILSLYTQFFVNRMRAFPKG